MRITPKEQMTLAFFFKFQFLKLFKYLLIQCDNLTCMAMGIKRKYNIITGNTRGNPKYRDQNTEKS